jgi:hypothetical protein
MSRLAGRGRRLCGHMGRTLGNHRAERRKCGPR